MRCFAAGLLTLIVVLSAGPVAVAQVANPATDPLPPDRERMESYVGSLRLIRQERQRVLQISLARNTLYRQAMERLILWQEQEPALRTETVLRTSGATLPLPPPPPAPSLSGTTLPPSPPPPPRLDETLRQRSRELQQQETGFTAFNDPGVRRRLSLTPTQISMIRDVIDWSDQQLATILSQGGTNSESGLRLYTEFIRESQDRLNRILTPAQQVLWRDMISGRYPSVPPLP
jgi:hypothetical protein